MHELSVQRQALFIKIHGSLSESPKGIILTVHAWRAFAGDWVDSWRHGGGRGDVPAAAPCAKKGVVPLRGAGPPRVQGGQLFFISLLLPLGALEKG